MITSHKQRYENNNLVTTQRATLERAHECSKRPLDGETQNANKNGQIVIEDYFHMATMDENVSWMKLTHLYCQIFL